MNNAHRFDRVKDEDRTAVSPSTTEWSTNRPTQIPVQNVYYMLAYAFRLLDTRDHMDVSAEEFDNLHELFAALISRGMKRQVKQGLFRAYLDKRESLPGIRGRIDLRETIKHRFENRKLIACNYDELSVDNYLNQIVKAAARILVHHAAVKDKYRKDVHRMLLFFDEVSDINPQRIQWSQIRLTPHTQSYRLLLTVSHLLLDGMLMDEKSGAHRLAHIIDDQHMERLYERFIYEYFAREWPQIRVSAPQISWALDDDSAALLPTMRSDVVLTSLSAMLIIDAKYYAENMQSYYDSRSIHSTNLYQIFTYVKNAQVHEGRRVSGMLLYARTAADQQPEADYKMSGNRISVRTLDLNLPFTLIAHQLDNIASQLT